MRLMSNFSYKDGRGNLTEVPVRYGDMNRQVAAILKKNSENTIQGAPFIACYIKDLQHDRGRMQDPTFVSKVNIREREFDETNNQYLNTQGPGYTIERLMPTPYMVTFNTDIWTTNTDQKFQLWEQITVLFNPSLELQSTDNYIDWSSLSVVELIGQTFDSRSVPQGLESDISIATLSFNCPIWINPPAKVKKLGIITKIITSVFASEAINELSLPGAYSNKPLANLFDDDSLISKSAITPGNFSLVVLNNTANIIYVPETNENEFKNVSINGKSNWYKILDLYPGQFRAGLSQIRLTKPEGTEIIAYARLNPNDDFEMLLNFDQDTVPDNSIFGSRGTIDAIIDPQNFVPETKSVGLRYLVLEDINIERDNITGYSGPEAWKNLDNSDLLVAANSVIEWNGSAWQVLLDSRTERTVRYVTNSYTGIQYKWASIEGDWQWTKSFEGIYDPGKWRIVL